MTTLSHYKKYWDEREARDKRARERLRQKAIRNARQLARILAEEFPVKKVVLFGSVLEKEGFKEDSDIDIAVEGLPKGAYFTAVARLMMESPFEVDLKPLEDVDDLLRKNIARGRVLYEKRAYS
ncbi:MAG: nucleotidyltransferase domain-containing protein [Nitrospirota bacterium]